MAQLEHVAPPCDCILSLTCPHNHRFAHIIYIFSTLLIKHGFVAPPIDYIHYLFTVVNLVDFSTFTS